MIEDVRNINTTKLLVTLLQSRDELSLCEINKLVVDYNVAITELGFGSSVNKTEAKNILYKLGIHAREGGIIAYFSKGSHTSDKIKSRIADMKAEETQEWLSKKAKAKAKPKTKPDYVPTTRQI